MRILRVALALLVVAVGVLIGAPPAFAGNWVVTVLDPVPDRFEPGRAYTIGFWALQHGSHPYSGTFETIGLRLLDAKGAPRVFNATPLPEAAHYATAIMVPTAGTWTVYGMHSPFQDYKIGTLTVPGGLSILPVPQPMQIDPAEQPWGDIRPPAVQVDPNRGPFDDGTTVVVEPQAGPTSGAVAKEPTSNDGRTGSTVLAVLAATALLLGAFVAYRRRRTPAPSTGPDRLDIQVGEAAEPEEVGSR